jgi:hypothetical protein
MKQENNQHVIRDAKRILNQILDEQVDINIKELRSFDDSYLFR